jgi:alkylation response protein AidB-like acyl-CoA dehydrogenase
MQGYGPLERTESLRLLLDKVEQIRETATAGMEEGERAATLPQATVDALEDSGLLRLKLPEALGGLEADPVTQTQVIEAMTYADAAAGWCLMIGATSIGLPAAFLPDEAMRTIFAGGCVPRAAIAFIPGGTATPGDNGYVLNGRWSFASGVRHAEWLSLGALIPPAHAEEPPAHRLFTFPASHAVIHDNWHTIGLKGTGSCDVSVADLFVPAGFMFDAMHGTPRRGGPLYRLGMPGFVANEHAGFAFGVAQKALDTIIAVSHEKSRGIPPVKLSARASFQKAVGACDLKLRAARQLVWQLNDEAWRTVQAGMAPDLRLQTVLRSCVAYATEVAVEVVTQAYRFAGGSAVFSSNTLEQALRDINTAAQHFMVSDTAYELHGRLALGLPIASPLG